MKFNFDKRYFKLCKYIGVTTVIIMCMARILLFMAISDGSDVVLGKSDELVSHSVGRFGPCQRKRAFAHGIEADLVVHQFYEHWGQTAFFCHPDGILLRQEHAAASFLHGAGVAGLMVVRGEGVGNEDSRSAGGGKFCHGGGTSSAQG